MKVIANTPEVPKASEDDKKIHQKYPRLVKVISNPPEVPKVSEDDKQSTWSTQG